MVITSQQCQQVVHDTGTAKQVMASDKNIRSDRKGNTWLRVSDVCFGGLEGSASGSYWSFALVVLMWASSSLEITLQTTSLSVSISSICLALLFFLLLPPSVVGECFVPAGLATLVVGGIDTVVLLFDFLVVVSSATCSVVITHSSRFVLTGIYCGAWVIKF